MKHRMRLFTLFALFLSYNLSAQQHLENGSFETIYKCPGNATRDIIEIYKNWSQPSEGTPDAFHTCNIGICNPYSNFAGKQKPIQGEGYAGLIAFSNTTKTYREYLFQELKTPLNPNQNYTVSFFVSLADYSGYAISGLGAGFSETKIENPTTFAIQPDTTMETLECIADTAQWVKLSFHYKAKGNERFLYIGNFKKFHQIKKIEQLHPAKNAVNNQDAYYYIDEISIAPSTAFVSQNKENPELPKQYKAEDGILRIQDLLFELNQSELNTNDKSKLNPIIEYFKSNSSFCLTIEGHTDATGNSDYNTELSLRRANSVCDYFVSLGIAKERIKTIGYGSSKPLNSSKLSDLNRRVEIRYSECR